MDSNDRAVFRLSGSDCQDFLQNIITNDVSGLSEGLVWTALLTPQGKYLVDFFLVPDGDAILLDVAQELSGDLVKRLTLYKLRADVKIESTEVVPTRGTGPAPKGAFADPRHPDLGWRGYAGQAGDDTDWTALRVSAGVPETGVELIANETYPLETWFDRLNGVDFRKGCYVGQEVTARMRHKTELRKGLRKVAVEGEVPIGTPILNADGRAAGTLYSQANGAGLAYLRFDRITDEMHAETARVSVIDA